MCNKAAADVLSPRIESGGTPSQHRLYRKKMADVAIVQTPPVSPEACHLLVRPPATSKPGCHLPPVRHLSPVSSPNCRVTSVARLRHAAICDPPLDTELRSSLRSARARLDEQRTFESEQDSIHASPDKFERMLHAELAPSRLIRGRQQRYDTPSRIEFRVWKMPWASAPGCHSGPRARNNWQARAPDRRSGPKARGNWQAPQGSSGPRSASPPSQPSPRWPAPAPSRWPRPSGPAWSPCSPSA